MEPEKKLMGFACSMSRSIDPRRPWFLTPEQSKSVNDLPQIVKLQKRVDRLSGALEGSRRAKVHEKAVKRLRNEKQRQRRLLLDQIVAKYNKEQPVRDSAQQLSGKGAVEDVVGALERPENRTPEHVLLIDAIMTLPATSLEEEVQRRITAINAITTYCGVEEGRSYGRQTELSDVRSTMNTKAQIPAQSDTVNALRRAIASVQADSRPLICFLCVGNPDLPMCDRVKKYATVGSLSRHFRRHVTKLKMGKQIDCKVCDVRGMHRMHLQNHAERFHGTVTRVGAKPTKQEELSRIESRNGCN
jgi:Protein of unknown function (DUF3435)